MSTLKKNMATVIFKTHAQGACLSTTKHLCAPHVTTTECACLGALERLVEKYSSNPSSPNCWELAQALRILSKYHLLHRSNLDTAKELAKRALGIVFSMPSTPKIDVCVFESDYAMAMYMAGDPADKERAKLVWCRIMNYAIDNVTHPGTHSAEDLLYKHTLCDRMICEALELTRGSDRTSAFRSALDLACDIGHSHKHMLAVELELMQ